MKNGTLLLFVKDYGKETQKISFVVFNKNNPHHDIITDPTREGDLCFEICYLPKSTGKEVYSSILNFRKTKECKAYPDIATVLKDGGNCGILLYESLARDIVLGADSGIKPNIQHHKKFTTVVQCFIKNIKGKVLQDNDERTVYDLSPQEKLLYDICQKFHEGKARILGYRDNVDVLNNPLWLPALIDFMSAQSEYNWDNVIDSLSLVVSFVPGSWWLGSDRQIVTSPDRIVKHFDKLLQQAKNNHASTTGSSSDYIKQLINNS